MPIGCSIGKNGRLKSRISVHSVFLKEVSDVLG